MNTSSQYQVGRDQMREEICALIAHHMGVARTFHGKGSDQHLRYKNLLEDIRIAHEDEIKQQYADLDQTE